MNGKKKGFTLIELLVVVLIIGILAAIALPQYQKAVLKSRYTTLMPIAKGIAEGNEAYFMEHGTYAEDPTELPIKGQENYPDGTKVELGEEDDYAFVKVSNPNTLKNNYIVYQHHSINYPDEIHCEAETGNNLAEWLCKEALKGTDIGSGITPKYTTYVLQGGSGSGIPYWAKDIDCSDAQDFGLSCQPVQDSNGNAGEKICGLSTYNPACQTTIVHEDGSKTVVACRVSPSTQKCTQGMKVYTYDKDGHETSRRTCTKMNKDETACETYDPNSGHHYDMKYDTDGNLIKHMACRKVDAEGKCTLYNDVNEYTYDKDGHQLTRTYCGWHDAEGNCTQTPSKWSAKYDGDGNKIYEGKCSSLDCTSYTSGSAYQYDDDGKKLSYRSCRAIDSTGQCTTYGSDGTDYKYDTEGRQIAEINCRNTGDGVCSYRSGTLSVYNDAGQKTADVYCSTVAANGTSCSEFGSQTNYEYNNGRLVSSRQCTSLGAGGACSTYEDPMCCAESPHKDYSYDANGNLYTHTCSALTDTGDCSQYSSTSYTTYDAAGHVAATYDCSDATCSNYTSATYYTYDDNGNVQFSGNCNTGNGTLNSQTGECTRYSNTSLSTATY